MDTRTQLLKTWANSLAQAALGGALTGDPAKPLRLRSIEVVRGPRAGALEIDAGMDAGALLNTLSRNEHALHRQFVPWQFTGDPSVYMTGRYVRLEAGWPDDMAEKNITLKSLGQHPHDGGRWIAGKNEVGATVTLSLSDTIPHYLFGGFTGSGKTWAMRSAIAQLARDDDNRFVLCDGKYGDGLACLQGIAGLVGPLACTIEDTRAALSWSMAEMRRRYETNDKTGRVIVVIDEVQEFTQDDAVAEMLRRLTAQGRGARVHVLVGTQNPLQRTFNDPSIKRNLTGRLALRTDSFEASKVVVGSATPRADHLLGAGDSYAITPSAQHRVQVAYIAESELDAQHGAGPEFETWPDYDPEAAGTLPENVGANTFTISPIEAAVSLLAAHLGKGQPTVKRMIEDATGSRPGGSRADRIRDYGREALTWLQNEGWILCDEPCETWA